MPHQFVAVGTRPIRHDGVDKVTGRAAYGADMSLPGMLHGAVLRSPHAHARIVRIDTTEAAALPGVKAIVTGQDFPAASAKLLIGEAAIDLARRLGVEATCSHARGDIHR